MTSVVPAAGWLPPLLRDAPDDIPGAPRLLDALLAAVDRQRQRLAQDIDQAWQDLFIESCADWAVPYLAALVGLPADAGRLEVAYAVALRRRKGTPAAFEDFAEVLTGWTARVIEGWQVTLWAQRLGHPGPARPAAVDLADLARHRIGTPFERTRRSVTPSARWSPVAATAIVWPWTAVTLRAVEAFPLPQNTHRFALHPLGGEAPLYLRPRPLRLTSDADGTSQDPPRIRDQADTPRRATYPLLQALAGGGAVTTDGGTWVLGETHPLATAASGPAALEPPLIALTVGDTVVPWRNLRFGSLPGDAPAPLLPAPDQAIVDIARGRVELGTNLAATGPLRASWHRAIPGSLGALGATSAINPEARVVVTVNPALPARQAMVATLADAFTVAETLSAASGLTASDSRPGRPDVEIRLETSDRLAAPPAQSFTPTLPRWRIVAPAGSPRRSWATWTST